MNRKLLYILLISLTIFSGCPVKKNKGISGSIQLSKMGITLKIPENFQSLPKERLDNIQTLGATVIEADPFTVIPQYAWADSEGGSVLVISELQFNKDAVSEKYPLDNIYIYKKNLEILFASGEIASEEITGSGITTVLLAMLFNEGDEDISLFKGLGYKFPEQFFMIDLYVVNQKVSAGDAFGFQDIFNSLGIY